MSSIKLTHQCTKSPVIIFVPKLSLKFHLTSDFGVLGLKNYYTLHSTAFLDFNDLFRKWSSYYNWSQRSSPRILLICMQFSFVLWINEFPLALVFYCVSFLGNQSFLCACSNNFRHEWFDIFLVSIDFIPKLNWF